MPNAFTRPDGSTQPVSGYKYKEPHEDVPRYDGSTAPEELLEEGRSGGPT